MVKLNHTSGLNKKGTCDFRFVSTNTCILTATIGEARNIGEGASEERGGASEEV